MAQRNKGFLRVNRREFLAGVTVGATAATLARSQAASYPNLRVERQFDQNAQLQSIKLVLSEAVEGRPYLCLTLMPEMFAGEGPLVSRRAIKTDLPTGDTVSPDGTYEITLEGADMFRHGADLDGNTLYHRFVLSADTDADGGVTWYVALETNLWINRFNNTSLTLDIPEGSTQPLADVMTSQRGFTLIVSSRFASQTLSAIFGEDVDIIGKQVAVLAYAAGNDTQQAEWFWTCQPLVNGTGSIGIFGGELRFRNAQFGWDMQPPADENTAPSPEFFINVGNDGATQGVDPLLGVSNSSNPSPVSGNSLPVDIAFVSPVQSETAMRLASTLEGFSIQLEASRDPISNERILSAVLKGTTAVTVTSADQNLLTVTLDGFSDDETGRYFELARSSDAQEWSMSLRTANSESESPPKIELSNLDGSWAETVNPARSASESDDTTLEPVRREQDWNGERRLVSVPFGPILTEGNLATSLSFDVFPGELNSFSLDMPTNRLSVKIPAGEKTFAELGFDNPNRGPLFLLNGVPPPQLTDFEFGQRGHLNLDGPHMGTTERPGLDIVLDAAQLRLRRSVDFLSVDLRFTLLRLQASDNRGGLEIMAVAPRAETEIPVDGPQHASLVLWLPPQHLVEQAFFRQLNTGVSPPAAKFDTADAEQVDAFFDILRNGNREARTDARKGLTDLQSSEELRAFAARFANDGESKRLPKDQQIFIGLKDADPDAAKIAWRLADTDARTRARPKLVEHLLRTEAFEVDFAMAEIPRWAKDALLGRKYLIGREKLLGPDVGLLPNPTIKSARDRIILQEFSDATPLTFLQDAQVQIRLSDQKERVSQTYAMMQDLWRAETLRRGLTDAGEFLSVRWAIDNPDGKVRDTMDDVLDTLSDPSGAAYDPFTDRARARLSGPSRVAFEWPSKPGELRPFTADDLLEEMTREPMIVPRRARVVQTRDENGNLQRISDEAEHLRLNGLHPPVNGSVEDWMAQVYAAASRAPARYETAIELPTDLQLAPAQDSRWKLARPVAEGFRTLLDPESETPPNIEGSDGSYEVSEPIWTLSLSPDYPQPRLRALWSSSYRPETFLARSGRQEVFPGADEAEIASIENINSLFDSPPRQPVAPWTLPRLEREGGQIVDQVEATEKERMFRTSMSPYDRDQIIKLTGVPGLPVQGGFDPDTGEVSRDSNSYLPPDGYELIDLAAPTAVTADDALLQAQEAVSHFIYRQADLQFRTLCLSSMGGSLDLDVSFQPFAAALKRDMEALFPAATLGRWTNLSISLRDIKVELAYQGYLAPLGNRAALVKVTARMVVTTIDGRGPTSVLIQRMFITVAEPVKSMWFDQPHGGRGWPCQSVTILTTVTPDIVDPTFGAPRVSAGPSKTNPSGRVSLEDRGIGLVFWPRTAAYQAADFTFEVQFDGRAETSQMHLVFVDNEAVNDPFTVRALVDYYNGFGHGEEALLSQTRKKALRRRVVQDAVPRRYAIERTNGDSSYETMSWVIGLEGRVGRASRPGIVVDANPEDDNLREARAKVLGLHNDYTFGPLLRGAGQPPFFPFVQFVRLRLDRIGHLLGSRKGQEAVMAFDARYLNDGLNDVADDGPQGIETTLNVLSNIVLEAGSKGARIGAIGRPAGRLMVLARNKGPLTLVPDADKADLVTKPSNFASTPPSFGECFDVAGAPREQGAQMFVPGLGMLTSIRHVQSQSQDSVAEVKKVLNQIIGDKDAKIFGVFKLSEIIAVTLTALEDNVPQIKEIAEFAEDSAADAVAFVRDNVITPLREAIEAIENQFEDAAVSGFGRELTLARVYARLGRAIAALLKALEAVEKTKEPKAAARLVAEIPAAGKELLRSLDEIAQDPISPIKLEIKRLFVDELNGIDALVKAIDALSDTDGVQALFKEAVEEMLVRLETETRRVLTEQEDQIIEQARTLCVGLKGLASDSSAGSAFEAAIGEIALSVLNNFIDHVFDSSTRPKDFDEVWERVQVWKAKEAVLEAIASSTSLSELSENFEDWLGDVEEEYRPYITQVIAVFDELKSLEALPELLDQAVQQATEEARAQAKALADAAKLEIEREINRVVREATQTLFAVEPDRLAQSVRILRDEANKIRGERDPGRIGKSLLLILREIDAVFLRGSLGKRFDQIALEAVSGFLPVVLDVFEASLTYAKSIAAGASPAALSAQPVAFLKEVQAPIKELRIAATALITTGGELAEDVSETIREELDKLSTTVSDAAGANVGFVPLRQLVTDMLDLMDVVRSDALQDAASNNAELRKILNAVPEMASLSLAAINTATDAVVRANVAFASFDLRAQQSLDAIKALRGSDASLADLQSLLENLPKREAQQMLRAWPQMIQQIGNTLKSVEQAYRKRIDDLQADLSGLLSDLDSDGQEALSKLIGGVELAVARFVEKLWDYAEGEMSRLVADFAATVEDPIADAEAELNNVGARTLTLVRRLRSNISQIGNDFPILRPALQEVETAFDAMAQIKLSATLRERQLELRGLIDAVQNAENFEAKRTELEKLRSWIGDSPDALINEFTAAVSGTAEDGLEQIHQVVLAQSMGAIAALKTEAEEVGETALEWFIEEAFNRLQFLPIDELANLYGAIWKSRNRVLNALTESGSTPSEASRRISIIFDLLDLAPSSEIPFDPAWLFVAVNLPSTATTDEINLAKTALLTDERASPSDLLMTERDLLNRLSGNSGGQEKLATLRRLTDRISGDTPLAFEQIFDGFQTTLERVLQADIGALVDFSAIREAIQKELIRILPTRQTREFDYATPIQPFGGIFIPQEPGTFRLISRNTIDVSGVLEGDGLSEGIEVEATALAELSPFAIRLLGSFNALTLHFSKATMTWKLGGTPTFDIDFLDYEIGPELEFVEQIASSMGGKYGNFYVKLLAAPLGVKAGYKLLIPSINLGGITFMNVGLAASALLPFEKRKAQFRASLSSRKSPFMIIAGVWGGGGHFALESDGRRITAFDASFVFGGGGAISYGPLTLQGRVSVGIFIRKVGSLTEISGDFFAGGSGKIAIFGISASLTVTIGMDGTGAMTGSAVFRFSFSIGFAKIRFAITLFKKEGKGFSTAGEEQTAMLRHRAYRVADLRGGTPTPGFADVNKITVQTFRQDQDYGQWQAYFSTARPIGYDDA